ncbi:hypothetical protein D9M73_242330 [compost metagenome]
MERQADHAEHVVRVEPGPLPRRLRPQGEEVLEYPPVHDDPADQRHQHEHAGDTDDVQADHAGVQVVVQGEEEFAADRLRQGFAGLRV